MPPAGPQPATSRLPAAKANSNTTSPGQSSTIYLSVSAIAGHHRQWAVVQTDFLRPFQNLLVGVAVAYADVRCMHCDVDRDDSISEVGCQRECQPPELQILIPAYLDFEFQLCFPHFHFDFRCMSLLPPSNANWRGPQGPITSTSRPPSRQLPAFAF